MKRLLILTISLLASAALASGAAAHHEPSIKDVMWPAINFTLIFGFILWKLRKPVAKNFAHYAESVEEIYHQAKNNQRMAETRQAELEAKLNSFEAMKVKEKEKMDEEFNMLKVEVAKETAESMEKMKQDSIARLEYEKQQLVRALNTEVVEKIMETAKGEIASTPATRKQVTERLVAKL